MNRIFKPIGIFGLLYFVAGVVLNILMYVNEAWPTSMFFILMAIGLLYIGLSFLKWTFKGSVVVQVLLGLLPAIGVIGPRIIS